MRWKRLRPGNIPLTKTGRIARKIEKFVKRNNLYKFHYIMVNGKKAERMKTITIFLLGLEWMAPNIQSNSGS